MFRQTCYKVHIVSKKSSKASEDSASAKRTVDWDVGLMAHNAVVN